MRANLHLYLGLLLTCGGITSTATDRFVSLDGGHLAPFTSWADAATNIQAAIDAASAGDTVWVTNGVYATGGKVMAGDLTNRVALDKAILVQSVNGPFVTTIQGAGAITGATAVRCAWLTNGATLQGFTLTGGGTRSTGDSYTLRSGGGAWCSSSNATLANCRIVTNACAINGGGAYQGNLRNCFLSRNSSGAFSANLVNCTVTSNSSQGIFNCRATNSIVAYNGSDVVNGILNYCSTLSVVSGAGNVVGSPRLMPDGIHLANDSPCRASGTNLTAGVDIDGEAWSSPPSIGCDQWQPAPLIFGAPRVQITTYPPGFSIGLLASGEEPLTCWWFRDNQLLEDDGHYQNAHTTNLLAVGILPSDAGAYQVVVSNAFGVATSVVAQLTFRYVDGANLTPAAPFTSWTSAATNIQDAIDAATAGEVVMVTNGIYATGGKVKDGDLTNRVALDKALLVQSVNGPGATIIRGAWDPVTTNGPLAVRCAWLTNGATLNGFTLRGGATRNSGGISLQGGGGVWCASSSANVFDSVLVDNRAQQYGGGAHDGTLNNCIVRSNTAYHGGGAYSAVLNNCAVLGNFALSGGGTYASFLNSCTVTLNSSSSIGAGAYWIGSDTNMKNCILWSNYRTYGIPDNYFGGKATYSCTTPLPSGTGNIALDPQLLGDGVHLAATSPCINSGSPLYLVGADVDGQAWANPPSMGCDQWRPEPLMAVQPRPKAAVGDGQASLTVVTAGAAPTQCWWTKDGLPLSDDAQYTNARTTSLLIRNFGVTDAGAYQVVVSNAFGVATSEVVQVAVHCVDAANAASTAPYTNWASAANTIQDAVDVAGPTDVVLVTNGVYAGGGRTKSGALTNRVVIDRPLLVTSVNGPDSTIIQGQWDPVSTNGPAAVRCAWLGDGAALSGFTLRNGATLRDNIGYDGGGGGASCNSTNAELANCVITNSVAWRQGGGVYFGLVRNSRLQGNSVASASSFFGGGGATMSILINSRILRNTSASNGGGVDTGELYNCLVTENAATGRGGGVHNSDLVNCTMTANTSLSLGGGVSSSFLTNCIVYLNIAPSLPDVAYAVNPAFTCSTPLLVGPGNIAEDPQLTDGWHLSATSPCRGLGSASAATGTDLDGDPWASPPSMGCDEVNDATFIGSLSVSLTAAYPEVAAYGSLPLLGQVSGRAGRVEWSFGDGPNQTNLSALTFHTWTNPGDYLVTFTAYNTDNPGGVTTNLQVHVAPLVSPELAASGFSSNRFTLSFPGQAGITYVVEQTTNLAPPINWQPVQTLISTGDLIEVTDPKATNAMRFYRTRRQ